ARRDPDGAERDRDPDADQQLDPVVARRRGDLDVNRVVHVLWCSKRHAASYLMTITAAPSHRPARRSSSATFASASAYERAVGRRPAAGASASSSSPSRRVRFATDRTVRSSQSKRYGNDGMSLM